MSDISPKIDIAFKKLFGVEENKDLLISLINSIVTEQDRIAEVTLLNPYNPQDFKGDKLSILDIKARGENGKLYNIEIQISDEADYDKRALYYWSNQFQQGKNYTSSTSKVERKTSGEVAERIEIREQNRIPKFDVSNLEVQEVYSKAIGIHILSFLSIPESEKYHNILVFSDGDKEKN